MFRKTLERINKFNINLVTSLIDVYQFLFSPLLGQNCRFHPSCSHYAKESLKRFGLMQGLFYIIKRLLRCWPLFEGGVDNVPELSVVNKNIKGKS